MFRLFLTCALLAVYSVLGTNLPLKDLDLFVHSDAGISFAPSDVVEVLRRHNAPRHHPIDRGLLDDGNIASALINGLRHGKEQSEAEASDSRHLTPSAIRPSENDALSSFTSFVSSDSEVVRPEKRLKGPLVPANSPAVLERPMFSVAQRRTSLEALREQVYIQLGSLPRLAKSADPLIEAYDDHLTVKDYGIFIAELANRPPWIYTAGPPASPTRFLIRQASHKHDSFQSVNRFKARGRNVRYFEAWQNLGETDSGLLFDYLGVFRVPQESSSKFKTEVLRDSVFPLRQYIVLSSSSFVVREIDK